MSKGMNHVVNIDIATTRFSDRTFNENKIWRENNGISGCIYGTPIMMSSKIKEGEATFVIEMNNDRNKIEGIGLVINRHAREHYANIHSNRNLARYLYSGQYRLDRSLVESEYHKKVIWVLEILLFKGSGHSKRSIGITRLPAWLMFNRFEYDFSMAIKEMFERYMRIDLKRINI
jgi:hypothetical protein